MKQLVESDIVLKEVIQPVDDESKHPRKAIHFLHKRPIRSNNLLNRAASIMDRDVMDKDNDRGQTLCVGDRMCPSLLGGGRRRCKSRRNG